MKGDVESPFIVNRPAAAATFGKGESGRPAGNAAGPGRGAYFPGSAQAEPLREMTGDNGNRAVTNHSKNFAELVLLFTKP